MCRGEDLNLHTLRYLLLRQACLPISPPRLRRLVYTIFNRGAFTFVTICSTLVPYPPIAQLVEQSPLKRTVLGSSPSGRTNKTHPLVGCVYLSAQERCLHTFRLGREDVEYVATSMRYECEVRHETCTVPVGKEIPSGRTRVRYTKTTHAVWSLCILASQLLGLRTRVRGGDMFLRPQGAKTVELGSRALSGIGAKQTIPLSDP